MKPLPVYFTPLAEEDLDQIEDYIAASCAFCTRHAIGAVFSSLAALDMPNGGP
jgi:plasmid stabilization system protein ParE